MFKKKKQKPKYLEEQKKPPKRRQKQLVSTKKKEKESKQFVQDFLPIKDIKNGIIETHDHRYVKILEIEPINFSLRSETEKDRIIYSFASWLKISNVRVQFKSISRRADPQKHIDSVKRDVSKENNPKLQEMARAYVNLVEDIGSREALTRRFFICLEYEREGFKEHNYANVYQALQMATEQVKSYMSQCGNNVIEPENEDLWLGELLYQFFNRKSSENETFQDRVSRVINDVMRAKGLVPGRDEVPYIPAIEFIAPRGLDLSHANYVIMDGTYYSYMYITAEGYPNTVTAGWTASLIGAGEGVDVDIYLTKQPRDKMVARLGRAIRDRRLKTRETGDTQKDFEEVRGALEAALYLKEGMMANNEDLMYMNIMVTISSSTLEDLKWKRHKIKQFFASQDIRTQLSTCNCEEAFLASLPLLILGKTLDRKSKRNVLTSGAAATYIFTAFELCDENGIMLGVNRMNDSLCIVDIYNSKIYKNANITVLGTSGSGKSFTLQLMALRMRLRGIQVFIIAPLKGHEFKRACQAIGGEYIKISSASADCINVMEIRPHEVLDADIDAEVVEQESLLAQKVQQLGVFFSLVIEDMTYEEEQLLDEAIMDVYSFRGITNDNRSLYDASGKIKEMPILADLHSHLIRNDRTARLGTILGRYVTGSASTFSQQTNVDLNNKYIVMDISELKGKLLIVGMFIALDICWDKIKEDRTKKKAIIIDETWKLIGAESNRHAAEFVLEIFKIIRGYGGSAISATQDLGDFFALEDGKYGRGIINNSRTKIILNLEEDEAETVKDSLRLSQAELMSVLTFQRGEALISANNNKVSVSIKASDTEAALITSDRAELEEQAERAKLARQRELARKREEEERERMIEEMRKRLEAEENEKADV